MQSTTWLLLFSLLKASFSCHSSSCFFLILMAWKISSKIGELCHRTLFYWKFLGVFVMVALGLQTLGRKIIEVWWYVCHITSRMCVLPTCSLTDDVELALLTEVIFVGVHILRLQLVFKICHMIIIGSHRIYHVF